MKNNKTIYKYSKITPQKKFHLLCLVLKEKMLIKDVFIVEFRQQKLLTLTTQLQKQSCSFIGMGINPISLNFLNKKKQENKTKNL